MSDNELGNLKHYVKTFLTNKETVKNLNKQNKELEKRICEIMKENDITTFTSDDGSGGTITYKVKESLKLN